MTDLLTQLTLASRALAAHRVGAATASHNIANANTAGYARQRTDLAATLPAEMLGGAFVGQGVAILGVSQARDRFLEAQVPGALGGAAFAESNAGILTSITALDPEAPTGIPASLSNFYAAVRELGRQPSDPSARRALVTAAQQAASAFHRSAVQIDGARRAVDDEVAAVAKSASDVARTVADLNAQLRAARAGGAGAGQAPNDLLDARRRAVEELVSLTGGQVLEPSSLSGGGDVNVQVGSVAVVAGTKAATFATAPDATNRGHLALTVQGGDGAPPRALDNGEVGGRIGGLLHARDEGLAATERQLDQAAADFAAGINAVHSTGAALDGSTGRALFDVTAGDGAALSIAVNASIAADPRLLAASSTGAPGDGGAANAMLATESASASAAASIIDEFGAVARRALSERDASAAGRDQLLALRESVSGVSVDEEMIEMTKAQRVFDAVGKVLTTADSMLQTLLELR